MIIKKAAGLAFLVSLMIVPLAAFAAEFRLGEQPSVGANENIKDDAYLMGGNVVSAGAIPGDLIAGGGNVLVSGAVGADVIALGGTVTVLSNVGDDVRIAGGTVTIQGTVGGDLIAGGGQITVAGAGIAGDAAIGGGQVRLDAPISGDLRLGGGKVYINAPIGGDVTINADTVTLGPAALISGDFTYKATKELVREEGARVEGTVSFTPRPARDVSASFAALGSLLAVGKFLALLASALLLGLVFRRYGRELAAKAAERPLLELGRGFLLVVALPVISVLLLITLVGIPLGILGLLALIIVLLTAWIVTPILLGSIVWRYFTKGDLEVTWKTILLGTLLFCIVGIVPFVGWLVQVLLILLTLGAMTAIKWEVAREWR